MLTPAPIWCAPLRMLRLSSNCGVVTARAVRGVLMNGVFTLLKLPLLPVALVEGKIFGKSGLASACVNRNTKRAKPTINSLFMFGVNCERHPRDKFFDARKTRSEEHTSELQSR